MGGRSYSRGRSPPRRRESRRRSRSRRSRSRDRGRGGGGRQNGYVVSWHLDKGFGFIKPNKGGSDVFAHVSALRDGDCLKEGSNVTFVENWDAGREKYRAEDIEGCCKEADIRDRRRSGSRRRSGGRSRSRSRGGGRERCRDYQRGK